MAEETRSLWSMFLDRRAVLRLLGIGVGAAALSACDSAAAGLPTSGGTGGSGTGGAGTSTSGGLTGTSGGLTGGANTSGSSTGMATTGTSGESVCVLNDSVTRGPFFIDEFDDPNDDPETGIDALISERSDVTKDSEGSAGVQAGLPLALQLTIYSYDPSTKICTALSGARVDIWQCNAAGVYSDVAAQTGQNFLRGYQVTGADGKVAFATIYPGWYPGRVTHTHIKVRLIDALADGGVAVPTEATTQLFFADSITAAVYGVSPYAARGENPLVNATDAFYAAMANPTANLVVLSGDVSSGYTATASLGVALGKRTA